ncbi:MAG: hypothetical protein MZV63_19560 [Marinilabiliales bacterium]|nr:hypothetical protein [Marinilabiliales bacterium]
MVVHPAHPIRRAMHPACISGLRSRCGRNPCGSCPSRRGPRGGGAARGRCDCVAGLRDARERGRLVRGGVQLRPAWREALPRSRRRQGAVRSCRSGVRERRLSGRRLRREDPSPGLLPAPRLQGWPEGGSRPLDRAIADTGCEGRAAHAKVARRPAHLDWRTKRAASRVAFPRDWRPALRDVWGFLCGATCAAGAST